MIEERGVKLGRKILRGRGRKMQRKKSPPITSARKKKMGEPMHRDVLTVPRRRFF